MNDMARVGVALTLLISLTALAADEAEPGDAAERKALEVELTEARKDMAEAARRLAHLQRRLVDLEGDAFWRERDPEKVGGDPMKRVIFAPYASGQMIRPRLGLLLGIDEGRDRVIAVTPGSGAERAGLRRGDRLVAINGLAVDADDPESIQRPMDGIEPGDTVTVEVERDGELRLLEVEAGEHPHQRRAFVRRVVREGDAGPGEIEREAMFFGAPGEDRRILMSPPPKRMRGLDSGSQLVSNNPELAPYFGTGEGVLVLRVEPENDLDLVGGDVILDIDGEAVSRPIDVGLALMRLTVGDPVRLRVMRSGTEITLEAVVPDGVMPGSWSGGLR